MKYWPLFSDLQDYQHAGSLVCGWSLLSGLSGACVQDPRLPLVSQPIAYNLLTKQNKRAPLLIRITCARKTTCAGYSALYNV